jgi:hypothetical protein
MELGQLIEKLRERLDDDIQPYLWSDKTLTDYFNDAVRQVCLRARAIIDSETPAVVEYPLPKGTQWVKLHPSILAVRRGRIKEDKYPLVGITAKRLWKRRPAWEMADSGKLWFWIPDYQEGKLYFDKPTERDSTLRLSVWRLPLDVEVMEFDTDEPAVPEAWHMDLLDWAAYCAYSQKDTEQNDDARANEAAGTFQAKIGRLPNMTEIRLWGISPIVSVPAEFL